MNRVPRISCFMAGVMILFLLFGASERTFAGSHYFRGSEIDSITITIEHHCGTRLTYNDTIGVFSQCIYGTWTPVGEIKSRKLETIRQLVDELFISQTKPFETAFVPVSVSDNEFVCGDLPAKIIINIFTKDLNYREYRLFDVFQDPALVYYSDEARLLYKKFYNADIEQNMYYWYSNVPQNQPTLQSRNPYPIQYNPEVDVDYRNRPWQRHQTPEE